METNVNTSMDGNQHGITKKIVEKAVKNDYGPEVSISSFKIIDFTKPGDNYISFVTSVEFEGTCKEKSIEETYIVKMNNHWKIPGAENMTQEFFTREATFLSEVKASFDDILRDINEPALTIPDCVYVNLTADSEMVILKDLRGKGFRMSDSKAKLDNSHCTLVLDALARIHAAGFIYKGKNKNKSLHSILPHIGDVRINKSYKQVIHVFKGIAKNCAKMLEDEKGYEEVRKWLVDNEDAVLEIYKEELETAKDEFKTICHGDMWSNNFLFRYNSDNEPEETILLDLQQSRIASVATDLNYFLFTCVDEENRREEMIEKLLQSYYITVKTILEKASIKVPFSFEELKEEYVCKHIYGILTFLHMVPLAMRDQAEAADFSQLDGANWDDFYEEEAVKNKQMMNNIPNFRGRILRAFDECISKGLFNGAVSDT